ncbi:hypothetical protein O181_068344 [Austropuccinia psidii MF-1]|uniref:Golgi apyrase n=1 Tax=Austropuccinia psidii MF-1 TaxID=1389203 RepID=A0A9Q3EWQ3_9BASI|nr:hypothetical protein [Austropuccinia psidii MF-1]
MSSSSSSSASTLSKSKSKRSLNRYKKADFNADCWKSKSSQIKALKINKKSLKVLPEIQTGVESGGDWQLKIEPGISSFVDHPQDLKQYLKPILDHALSLIPPNQVSSTPFYLLATAGMRLLSKSQQALILDTLCHNLTNQYQFFINDCKDHIRIISGEEEGEFGWIAVNYLMNGFHPNKNLQNSTPTFGFLDMGGASTQIAFEPDYFQPTHHSDNLINLTLRLLDGTPLFHSLFVTTWLGFGTNMARERYSQSLLQHHLKQSVNLNHKTNQKKPQDISDSCLPDSLFIPSPSSDYQFKGTGNFNDCVKSLFPLLNKNATCLDEPCLFDGKHVPPINFSVNHFIGISEYWYSTQDLWSMGGTYNSVKFQEKAIQYCHQNWNEILQDYKSNSSQSLTNFEISRLQTQCFKAAWIINVLHQGIGIPRDVNDHNKADHLTYNQDGMRLPIKIRLDNPPPKFQSVDEVGHVKVSWTLGKMVMELSKQASTSTINSTVIQPSFDGVRGVHTSQIGGLKAHLSDARSWFDPMILLGLTIATLAIWFLYLCSKSLFAANGHDRSRGQGYLLASMEEGDTNWQENSFQLTNHSRPCSPRLISKSRSSHLLQWLSSPSSRPMSHAPSRSQRRWPFKLLSNFQTITSVRSQSPRPLRNSRVSSPLPSRSIENLDFRQFEDDDDSKVVIPPVSITTSLATSGFQSTSARPSFDENLLGPVINGNNHLNGKKKKLNERNPNNTSRSSNSSNKVEDRSSKQRLNHSKSCQTLTNFNESLGILEPKSPRFRRETSWNGLDDKDKISNYEDDADNEIMTRFHTSKSTNSIYNINNHSNGNSQVNLNSFLVNFGKGRHSD